MSNNKSFVSSSREQTSSIDKSARADELRMKMDKSERAGRQNGRDALGRSRRRELNERKGERSAFRFYLANLGKLFFNRFRGIFSKFSW